MKIRTPRFNKDGTITCEVEDAMYGWVSTTVSSNETDPVNVEIYLEIIAGQGGPVMPYFEPAGTVKTFEETRQDLITRVDLIAKEKRDQIIRGYSAGEMASWPIKYEEANRITTFLAQNNNTITAAQCEEIAPKLYMEAGYRQTDFLVLVDKVLLKSVHFSELEAKIAGYCGHLQDQLRVVATDDYTALHAIELYGSWPA